MPVIARFYGIVIKMYFWQSEHNPPHFHCIYGESIGVFEIQNLEMLEGDLPPQIEKLVRKWAAGYQKELLEMWETQIFTVLPPFEK